MKQTLVRIADAIRLLRRGELRPLLRSLRSRLSSETRSVGLSRDLRLPFPTPDAAVPLIVRPLHSTDDTSFLALEAGPPETAKTRLALRRMLAAGLRTCWAAVDDQGMPCYVQWLIAPEDNAAVHALWGGLFPELGPRDALLEGAFTVEACRGKGIMPHAMARIAEAARGFGADRVITFVEEDNVPSLKGCRKAGFSPYVQRVERWFLFMRFVRFEPLEATVRPRPPAADPVVGALAGR